MLGKAVSSMQCSDPHLACPGFTTLWAIIFPNLRLTKCPFALPKFAHRHTLAFRISDSREGLLVVVEINKRVAHGRHPESVAVGAAGWGWGCCWLRERGTFLTLIQLSLFSVSKALFHPLLGCVVFLATPVPRHNEKKCLESFRDTSTQYSAPLG